MRRLTFSIRDVLWLTLVVALAAGWLIDRQNVRASFQRELLETRKSHKEEIAEIREWIKSELPHINSPIPVDALTGQEIDATAP